MPSTDSDHPPHFEDRSRSGALPLDAVIATAELDHRPSRPPDFKSENRALGDLMRELARADGDVLQALAETTLCLCRAHSAGLSILEEDDDGELAFRWRAAAGQWSIYLGGTMPRRISPCGTVLDRNTALLMVLPERHYPFPPEVTLPIHELLLVPFHVDGKAQGTIWVMAHDATRHFEREDLRLTTSLGRFAATAYQVAASHRLKAAFAARQEIETQQTHELAAMQKLQEISTRLVQMDNGETLYDEILDAAKAVMNADMASLQRYEAEERMLRLLAHKGFDPVSAAFWEKVRADSIGTCGAALRVAQRVFVSDVERCEFMVGTDDLEAFRRSGIRAAQSTPLVSRSGRLLGMLSTHWRRPHDPAQRELRLLDMLARQAADFIERTEAEEALRASVHRKNEFLAMLAHELRNPLAPIRNGLGIAGRPDSDPAAVQAAVKMMRRQVDQMVRLVDDLLDVSRISRGKIALRKERFELAAAVSQAVEAIQPLCERKSQMLNVTLPARPVLLEADPARFVQVVVNLLNNACKFTGDGGQIQLIGELVGEPGKDQGNQVIIRVRDSGVGIAREQLSHIFEMFMQGDSTLERSDGGLGIGLTLVKHLVELHDGAVEAQSDGPGRGSEFTVRLPLPAPVTNQAQPTAETPVGTFAHRILVVDDYRDTAETMALLLRLSGHETYAAHDGLGAIEAAERLRPEVVLLDIGLPGLNGYEVARRIRREPWSKGMVLIALTGWGQDEDRLKSHEAGFDAHLIKPVEYDALLRVVQELTDEDNHRITEPKARWSA